MLAGNRYSSSVRPSIPTRFLYYIARLTVIVSCSTDANSVPPLDPALNAEIQAGLQDPAKQAIAQKALAQEANGQAVQAPAGMSGDQSTNTS